MAEVSIKNVDESAINTILSEDIDFTGELICKKSLIIKGKVSGIIKSSSDLYIEKSALIKAQIDANIISIKGYVEGNITSTSIIELFSTAKINGDITSPAILMESGSLLNGICTMERKN